MSKFNLEEKEIFQVKVYQSVQIDGKEHTYFNTIGANGKKAYKINLIPELQMVHISSDKDEILVALTNISCISLNSKIRKANTEFQKSEKAKLAPAQTVKKAR